MNGDRRVRELWRFSCEGFLGALTREHAEREAALEAELEADFEGDEIPFRMLRPTIANEPDRDKRGRLDEIRTSLTEEHLNPLHLDAARTIRDAVRQLGASTYLELYRDRFGMELDALAEQCRAFLDDTERLWEDAGDKLFRERAGVPLSEAKRYDTSRVFRAPAWDNQFPGDKMVPALEATLSDLGIDLKAQRERPPGRRAAPAQEPARVLLADRGARPRDAGHPADGRPRRLARALPRGRPHRALRAHVARPHRRGAPARRQRRHRGLGDAAAASDGRARVAQPPPRLPAAAEFAAEGAAGLLFFVRRYCAKLLYELEFHAADDPASMSGRYVELLGDALKIEPSPKDYLGDIDAGFYVSSYLRSWAFEAQLRDFLREEFDANWFAKREAGSLLRELWELGQQPTAEELLKDVTGQTLDMAAVGSRVREFV